MTRLEAGRRIKSFGRSPTGMVWVSLRVTARALLVPHVAVQGTLTPREPLIPDRNRH